MAKGAQQILWAGLEDQTYQLLFDLANDGLMILSTDGYIRDLNRTAYQSLGYTKQEVVGKHISQLTPPEYAKKVPNRIQRIKKHGNAVFESALYRKDGSPMSVEVSVNLIELNGEQYMFSVVRDVSERKAVEEALMLTQIAVDRGSDAVFWKDLTGRILKVNDQACRNTGYTRDELVGMRIWDLDPGFDEAHWNEMLKTFRQKQSVRIETSHRRKDGSMFPVEVVANYVSYNDKEYNVSFVRDISERKAAEEAQSLTQIAVDRSSDAVFLVGMEGNVLKVNDQACKALGYDHDELIGMHVWDFDPNFVGVDWPARMAALREKQAWRHETTHKRKDGSIFPVEVSASYIRYNDKEFAIAFARDISERKSVEEALMLTQISVDRSSDAVYWMDMVEGTIFKVNEQAVQHLGYSHEEFNGMHVWDINPEYSRDMMLGFIQELRKQGSIRVETLHRRKDGSIFPIEVNANYVRYRDKEYNIAFVRDITERKRAEEALRDSEERLHQAVRVSQTGIFDHDHLTNTIYWSPEQRAIYGISLDEPITLEGFLARVYPADRDKIAMAVQHAHDPNGDGLFDVQHRIIRCDGELRWIMTRSETLFEGEGDDRRPARTVGAVMDITERMRTEEKVTYLAFYDSLTGLANRRLLHERLERALAVSTRNNLYGALLFIDLDHFKTINDTVGHEYGDMLLKEVAQRLRSVLRDADTVSRPGGDEFVVILEEIGSSREQAATQAKAASDKILDTLSKRYQLREREYTGSASIGVALFRGREDRVDELLKRSDMAMYEAKRAGRGVARFFDPLMQASFETRAKLEADIRKAIELGQFMLYYQARVDKMGKALGAEALLRWEHHERGMVMPGEFIPVCEETGLILPVGEWVLEAACDQLRMWEEQPATRDLKMSVNISANQFRQDNFISQVVRVLEKTGIDPSRLELELTESIFLENIENYIAKMEILRDIGVAFALDDFGTGYSSLSYLKKLPLNQVKIDRSFVRDIAIDRNDEVIVQTIIKMGQTLGLEVIAEGVETDEQRRMLEHYGCENFQGFLFGKPVPVTEFEQSLIVVPGR